MISNFTPRISFKSGPTALLYDGTDDTMQNEVGGTNPTYGDSITLLSVTCSLSHNTLSGNQLILLTHSVDPYFNQSISNSTGYSVGFFNSGGYYNH